jgi:hypothetical protein
MIRLSLTEIDALIAVLSAYLHNESAELRLYGSRAQPERKGGDIDLLLLVNHAVVEQQLNEKKHYILAQMKQKIGVRKIDLAICHKDKMSEDVFIRMILPESVLLKSWTQTDPAEPL